MRRLQKAAVTLAAVIVAAAVPLANATGKSYTPRQAAKQLAADYLAPIASPDTRTVRIRTYPCRQAGRWYSCRVSVHGKTICHGIVRVLEPTGDSYTGWVPRMRCR